MASQIKFDIGFNVDKSGLEKMQSLFQQIAYEASKPGNKLNTELQQAAKTATTLDGILEKTFNTDLGTLNVTKFNQELSKSGLNLRTIQSDFSKVGTQGADAYNRLAQAILGTNQQLKQSNKLLDSMFDSIKNVFKYNISASIFNNLTSNISQAFNYTKQLDTSLNDIRIVTDKSADNMEKFAQRANDAAKSMGANTLDYTNASLIYYQQGLSDAEVAARAETTIKAANVTGQTGEEVSEQLTAVWNGYKVTAEETEAYVDKLAAVAATTAADLEELSVGMSKVASAASAMGVDFDDLNAQIATIVSVTRQAPESVGTALKTIYARLGDLKVDGVDEFGVSLGEVSSQLAQMGIQVLDQEGNLRDMTSVIAEVADKWNGWTEAQRQAAAVAMAGKRQYNNLIALFDNWDMYTDALNTSTEALGTLQEQQDIYMESTSAKLKTLKAAWQGLYDDAINQDEVNGGIELLTNLVETFDNLISSFGGGIKALSGFGAVLSSVFNKQIIDNINLANQKIEIFKNNVELAQTANQVRQQGTAEAGDSARSIAIEANTQEQIKLSEQIYNARVGLNQEQAKTLIGYQKEIGALTEEIVYGEERIKQTQLANMNEEEIKAVLAGEDEAIIALNEKYAGLETTYERRIADQEAIVEKVKKEVIEDQNLLKYEEDYLAVTDLILDYTENINKEQRKELENLLEKVDSNEALLSKKEAIYTILDKTIAKEKVGLQNIRNEEKEVDKILEDQVRISNLKDSRNNIRQQAGDMLQLGNSAAITAQKVTAVTSALGNMAMAWSSVSSLMDTWNNESISVGDKITQIFMTLGMTIPIVISNFSKLNEVFGIQNGLSVLFSKNKAKEIALTQLSNTSKAVENTLLEQEAIKRGVAVTALDADVQASIRDTVAKQAEKIATDQAANAQWRLNASMLANPVVKVVLVITALTTAIVAITKAYEKYIQAQIDANNATIEEANKIQAEVDANEELYNSYDKLYNKYKNNQISKEELVDSTDKLAEKYNIEEGHLAKLTGNYEKFTIAVKKAREEELKRAKQSADNEVTASKNNILPTGQQTQQGARYGNIYEVSFDSGIIKENSDKEAEKYIQQYVTDSYLNQTGSLISDVDANDPEAIVKQYEQIVQAISEMDEMMSYTDRASSEVYQNAKKYVDSMTETVEQYKTALSELDNYNVQLILNQHNLEGINSFKEYNEEVTQIREELSKEFNGDSEKVNQLLSTYLQGIDNEFVSIGYGLELLKEELHMTDEEFAKLQNWSDEDKKILLSGKIEFDGYETEEELKKALDIAKNSLSEDDLTIVTSLRSKITSDKKLTKKEVEEAAGEESTLMQDYSVEMADFDNQSQLDQLESLNKIVDDKIEINKKYIQNAQETAEKEKETLEDRKENWESEKRSLEGKKSAPGVEFTDEDKERLAELKSMLEDVSGEIENLNEIAENGLPFEDIDQLNFDNLISGIDSVITKADLLQELAEKVGKNWTIAANDIESFARNFPEIVAAQENYNALQDGSIQLTQQGQEILQQTLGLKQQELEATNEAYQQELQKQADLQLATAEYYEDQAEQLRSYLSGKQSAKQTEMNLEQNTFDFTQKLTELTGQDNEELTNTIQENYKKAADTNKLNAQAIYDNYVAIGNIAVAASQAFLSGQFNPTPAPNGSGTSGASASTFTSSKRDVNSGDYLKELTDAEIQGMIDSAEASAQKARDRAAEYLSKKLKAESGTNSASKAMQGAISGTGGKESKSGSGGSSKDKKDKEEKEYKEEFDRYWQLKKAIEAVDQALEKLDKRKQHTYGWELINVLKQENELLEKQKACYEQLAQAQEAEAAELRGQLGTMGVMFDASGAIVNYAEATAAALAAYNQAIQQYNAGLIDETTLGVAEKSFENFKKLLERYDTLYYTEMKETQDKLEEIKTKEIENNLKAWETELKVKIDWQDLKKGWRNFKKEMEEDFTKIFKDLRIDSKTSKKNAKNDTKKIGYDIDAIKDVNAEIDKMMAGGESSMFQSISEAQEKLKELNEDLQSHAKDLKEEYKQAWDNYLEGIDQVSEKLEQIQEQYENINKELEFQGQLIELLYGEDAYDLKDSLYEGQIEANSNRLNSLVAERDTWKQLFEESGASLDNMDQWTEDQKKLYDNWQEAQQNLNDLTLEQIQLLQNQYMNTVKQIITELEKGMNNGQRLEDVKTNWERIRQSTEGVYDNVQRLYQVQTLMNKYDTSIADTKDLAAQQKLNKAKEQELEYLKDKKELTEYDIQAANLRYELALRQIALEEAQNNKTSMKLTRNEQGNWSYQYVADDEDVADKQQNVLDTWNQLYELADEAHNKNIESMMNLNESYLEQLQEIYELSLTDKELAEQRRLELDQWYQEQRQIIIDRDTQYEQDQLTATAGLLQALYDQDSIAFGEKTEKEQELAKQLSENVGNTYGDLTQAIKDNYDDIRTKANEVVTETNEEWKSSADEILNTWVKNPDSVKKMITTAYSELEAANKKYQTAVDNLAKQVGRDFGESGIKGAIDKATRSTQDLDDKTKQLCEDGERYINKLKDYVDSLKEAWDNVKGSINEAISAIEEYLQKKREAEAEAESSSETTGGGGLGGVQGNSGNGGGTGSGGSGSTNTYKPDNNNVTSSKHMVRNDKTGQTWYFDSLEAAQRKASILQSRESDLTVHYSVFDTGGYTGNWNDTSGRLALLHQKELVLNKDDTENFLTGINTIRDLASVNGSIEKSIMQAVLNTASQLGNIKAGGVPNGVYNSSSDETSNVFNITAEFPNANSVEEIRQAILTLPNIASQYANSNLR